MSSLDRLHRELARSFEGQAPKAIGAQMGRHGLFSLGEAEIDQEAREHLRGLERRVAAGNLILVAEFQRMVDALPGIEICPLKGIFLLDRIYSESYGARAGGDIDVLVHARDFVEVDRWLLGQGLGTPQAAPHHRIYTGRPAPIELHLRLGYKFGPRSTWDDLEPVPGRVHDRDVFVLDDSTTLVHLLSHFVKHAPFSCAKWVEDLLCWEATEWKPSKNRAEVQNSCRLSGAIGANTASKRRLTTV